MKASRIAVAFVVGAAAAAALYWWFSPYLAMRQLRDAAARHDAAAFDARVDYTAVREDLKAQLSGRIAGAVGQPGDNPLAAIGNILGRAVANPMVDALVRPDAVMDTLNTGELKALPLPGAGTVRAAGDMSWWYRREGANRFIAQPRVAGRPDTEPTIALALQRHGFADWKLEAILLPPPPRP
jgi:hypothetical protein